MYTYLGKWIMVNNSKCECPFLPAHPWKSPFLEASWVSSLGFLGALPAGPEQWTGFAWALPSRDHVSPPGAAARPQGVQTSQYRSVVAIKWSWLDVVPPQD